MAKQPTYNFSKTIISVHANDQGDTCNIICLENLVGNELQDAIKIYRKTVNDLVPKNSKGKRVLSWINRASTNTYYDLLYGEIDEFRRNLHERMTDRFGAKRIPWTDTQVDVEAEYGRFIYPSFDMTNIIYS